MLVNHIPGGDHIAAGFGHLLSVLIQDQPQANDILVAVLLKQQRADGVQRVEPAAGLVNRLTDVISRELGFEFIQVFKRVMQLRHRHRA